MSEYIEKEGKTVESAIEEALSELNIEKENAEIEVIDEGSKGIFGLIGGRNALVRVYKKIDFETISREFLQPIFDSMGIDEQLEFTIEEDSINVKISAEDIGIVIGRRGETLDSLQYLLGLVINKNSDKFIRVTLDVGNYREKEKKPLKGLQKGLLIRLLKTERV